MNKKQYSTFNCISYTQTVNSLLLAGDLQLHQWFVDFAATFATKFPPKHDNTRHHDKHNIHEYIRSEKKKERSKTITHSHLGATTTDVMRNHCYQKSEDRMINI